jgi:hypothetical protein
VTKNTASEVPLHPLSTDNYQSPYCDQGEKMNKILQTEDFEDWKTVSTEKLIKLHHKAVDYRNAKNKEYIEARDREIEMQQELNNRFGILSEEH